MTTVAERPIKRRARTQQPVDPPPVIDPVSQYASDVLEGRIVVGRAVRLACERHLRDLGRQRTPDFPYYFEGTDAAHVIAFFPQFLTLETGDPFILPPWLQFSYGVIFGWKRVSDGLRKFQHGFFETSKGSGKTPSAGGIGLYGMLFDDEPYAEIYSTGFDKGQASIILNDAIRMANASDDLRDILEIDKYNIAHLASGSFFRASSSQHRSKSGPRPSYVLSDEIHEHRDGTVVSKMEGGFKNRRQPLGLKYTNSGSDKTSYCWELHQRSLAVLEGTLVDEQWFAYICHLDPCAEHFAEGYRQPKDGCARCDDWTDPKVWPKIAPALGIVIQPKYLQDAIDTARSVQSEYALKRRLNFCIWTETHQVWIGSDAWDACKVEHLSGTASACAVGFDMSEKLDLTACCVARRVDDQQGTPADSVEVVEVQDGKEIVQTLNLNFCVELIPYFWLPAETMLDRIRTERMPFDVWERAGHLRVTPGPIVDHDLIFEQYTKEIHPAYKPSVIGYDQHNATQFGAALRDRARLNAVEVPQGRALSEAFKWFEALVRSKRIRHLGNPVMGWCVANCEAKFDRYRNMWVEKPSATKRIDGAIAAVEALKLLMTMPRTPSYQVMVFGGKR